MKRGGMQDSLSVKSSNWAAVVNIQMHVSNYLICAGNILGLRDLPVEEADGPPGGWVED